MNTINHLAIVDELHRNQFSEKYLATGNLSFHEIMSEAKVKKSWLLPLVKIVEGFIRSGNPFYKRIYAGERLFRPFSPHVSNEYKKNYFESVLNADIAIFSKYFNEAERVSELHDFNDYELMNDEFSLTTLGDCLMSQVNSITSVLALEQGIGVTKHEHYIGAFSVDSDFDKTIHIHTNDRTTINIIAISPFSYWGIPGFRLLMKRLWQSDIQPDEAETLVDLISEFVTKYVDELERNTKAVIFLHNAAGLPWLVPGIFLDFYPWNASGEADVAKMEKYLGKINNNVDSYVSRKRSVFLIDERKIAANIDRKKLNDEILTQDILEKSLFHYNFFGFCVADSYITLMEELRYIKSVKILFVDFDNTLWLGNMAEGAVQHYLDRQEIIRRLYQAGILLVALSKNDEKNIRWSEITVDYDSFCVLKINWNNKVTNIVRACKALNISVDQTMVLDDSPQERGLIKSHLPAIKTLDSTLESSWATLKTLCTFAESRASGDINRTRLYRDNVSRSDYLSAEKIDFSLVDNLKKLYTPMNIRLTVRPASQMDVERIHELLQRTNQFNCSGSTYTPAELRKLISADDYKILSFSLKDGFGDMGLVGAVFIRYSEGFCCIENFLLSCRAMGYFVEKSMMGYVLNNFLVDGAIKAILIPTEKNVPAQLFYKASGFYETEQNHLMEFCAKSAEKPPAIEWITLDILL